MPVSCRCLLWNWRCWCGLKRMSPSRERGLVYEVGRLRGCSIRWLFFKVKASPPRIQRRGMFPRCRPGEQLWRPSQSSPVGRPSLQHRCPGQSPPWGRLCRAVASAYNSSLFTWRGLDFYFLQQENHLKMWNITLVILGWKMIYIAQKSLLWISYGNKEWIL